MEHTFIVGTLGPKNPYKGAKHFVNAKVEAELRQDRVVTSAGELWPLSNMLL